MPDKQPSQDFIEYTRRFKEARQLPNQGIVDLKGHKDKVRVLALRRFRLRPRNKRGDAGATATGFHFRANCGRRHATTHQLRFLPTAPAKAS
jgi:hypothetical protein